MATTAAHPKTNFLTLEIYDPGVTHTLLLASKQGLTNIRVTRVDAPELFRVTTPGTAVEVWTFFPDPWLERRYHRRRIVQGAMAGDIHHAPTVDGIWRTTTDIEDYALHVHGMVDGLDGWKSLGSVTISLLLEHVGKGNADIVADMPHAGFTEPERFEGRMLTNFEKKGLAAGRMIHDFTYQAVALD